MTSIKLEIKTLYPEISSRAEGALLRQLILAHLKEASEVILDFAETSITPSFADEALGLLCNEISLEIFKQKIKMVNLSATNKALILRVIANRFKV